jgi:hypothetical protein
MRFKQAVFALLQFMLTLHAAAQNPLDLPPCPDADKVHPAQIRTIQGEPVDGHWHEPQTYEVRMYEKTEWSMSLNEKTMMAISDFFRKNGGGKNGLNPYDPDQVDVWAEIWTPQSSKSIRINGFFYQHMERITQGDVNAWTWKDIATPHPFRFRYAAKQAGWHYVKLFANVQGHGSFESKAFAFLATSNAPTEGSLELSPNHRYYQWSDGKLFFPVGQNLLTAHFCTCELRTSEDVNGWSNKDCATCYNDGNDDPCCGLSNEWRQGFWRSPSTDVRKKVEHPASFIKMLEEMEALKAAGANAFRTILTPISYDFEFEKLNNYHDRQFMAWELDQLLDKADTLDLKVELCMLLHTQFTHSFSAAWDWTDLDRWNEGNSGYCYYTERSKTKCDAEPASFFSSEESKSYYKKKLRYFFARYGYSSSILHLELLSEANNVGHRQGNPSNPDDWWGWLINQLPESRDYTHTAQTRYHVGQWSDQMARFIKEDLQQSHLVACSYTGTAMMNEMYGKIPPCDDPYFDIAQISPHIDIIAHSSYDTAFDRWKKWTNHDEAFSSEWYRLQCPLAAKNGKRKYLGYPGVNKPVVHSENGNDIAQNTDDAWFEKDLWCNAFGGYATSGMAWGMMYEHPRWNMFGQVNRFMHEIIFPMTDLAQDTTWSVDWNEGGSSAPNSRRMEVVYMKNNTASKYCAFGILMNRTWNPANLPVKEFHALDSKSILTQWESKFKDGVDGISFMPLINIPYRYSIAPTIANMGQCNSYEITYYDPYTLQIIQRSDDDVILGKGVRLKEFPDLNKTRPYVLFTVVRNGNCITK